MLLLWITFRVCLAFLSVHYSLVVTCWLTSWLAWMWSFLIFCHFPIGFMGQVWCLIVSIPDLCILTDGKQDRLYAFKLSEGLYKSKWVTFADPLQRTGWLIGITLELRLFTSWLGKSIHCRKRWAIAPYLALKLMFLRQMDRDMRFPTMWYVRPTKPQISLRKRAVLSAFASPLNILWMLSYWRNFIWSF